MKKAIIITSLLAIGLSNSNATFADASKEENIGFASGALTGAALGGPVGLLIGATVGALLGDQVEKASQAEIIQNELALSNQNQQAMAQKIAALKHRLEFDQEDNQSQSIKSSQLLSEGLTLHLMFTTNSSALSDDDHANINQIASVLLKSPQLKIRLDGYADPRGNKQDNLVLSQQRVESVVAAFSQFGIQSERLIIKAHGEAQGFTHSSDLDSFAMARKVSINFIEINAKHVAQN